MDMISKCEETAQNCIIAAVKLSSNPDCVTDAEQVFMLVALLDAARKALDLSKEMVIESAFQNRFTTPVVKDVSNQCQSQ